MQIATEDTARLLDNEYTGPTVFNSHNVDMSECFGEPAEGETDELLFYLTFLGLMIVFFVGAAYVEKNKPAFGHETGLTILLGVGISFLMWWIVPLEKEEVF